MLIPTQGSLYRPSDCHHRRSQMPYDLPPWQVVYQPTRRWIEAGVFKALVQDLRELIRIANKRNTRPSAMILDSRPLQSTPESGARAGYDGAKQRKGSSASKTQKPRHSLGFWMHRPSSPGWITD